MEYTTYINYHWVHILVWSTATVKFAHAQLRHWLRFPPPIKTYHHDKNKLLLKVALTRNIRILSSYHRFCLVSIKIYKKRSSISSVLIKYSCLKIEKNESKMSSHVVLDNIQLSKNRRNKSKMSSHVASIDISIRDVS